MPNTKKNTTSRWRKPSTKKTTSATGTKSTVSIKKATKRPVKKTPSKKPKKSLLICGVSAEKVMRELVAECNRKIYGLQASLLPVKNEFFGETVTCTGLLTGRDIVKAVLAYTQENGAFDELVLAGNTMKEFEDIFLCGMTLNEMKKKLDMKNIRVNRRGGRGFVEILATRKDKRRK